MPPMRNLPPTNPTKLPAGLLSFTNAISRPDESLFYAARSLSRQAAQADPERWPPFLLFDPLTKEWHGVDAPLTLKELFPTPSTPGPQPKRNNMANLNRTFLIGNLTRDPDLRYTPKGLAVAEISLAVNRIWTDESGQKHEETVFVDVTLWARQAEIAGQYLHKGNPVFIEGRLQLDTWEDKQTGEKRSKLRVVAENLQLLGKREGSEAASLDPARPPRPASARTAPTASRPPSTEPDDILY
jgi:single stranded DNA-binding protein